MKVIKEGNIRKLYFRKGGYVIFSAEQYAEIKNHMIDEGSLEKQYWNSMAHSPGDD